MTPPEVLFYLIILVLSIMLIRVVIIALSMARRDESFTNTVYLACANCKWQGEVYKINKK